MRENHQTKIKLILNCGMVRQDLIRGNTATIVAHFRTRTAVNLEGNDDADELRIFLEPMEEGIFNFNQRGSNWRFQRVVDLEINLAEYDQTDGSFYIPLPTNWMAKKRSSTWKTNTTNALNGAWQGPSILSQYIPKESQSFSRNNLRMLTGMASKSLASSNI